MPITREEKLLNTLGTGVASGVSPITREEQYLAYIAGETATKPDAPITRKEAFLDRIPQGGGGGGGVTIKNQNKTITENGTYTADSGYTGLGTVTVDVQASGGTGENKLAQLASGEIVEITAEDLAGVTKIKDYAFYGCKKLADITIPEGITEIGMQAFCALLQNGENLVFNIKIPTSLKKIGSQAFYRDTGWITANVHISDIGAWWSINYDSVMSSPLYIGTLDSRLYLNGELITDIEVPATITHVPPAFGRYNNLKSVKIHDNVVSLSESCFLLCSNLTSVTFGEDSNLTAIPNGAFRNCVSLESIVIPSKVTKLATAFYGCSKLANVTVKATKPPTLNTTTFTKCDALAQIIVPVGCAEAYKAATNWSAYADIIVEEGATE